MNNDYSQIITISLIALSFGLSSIYSLISDRLPGKGGSIYRKNSPKLWFIGTSAYIVISITSLIFLATKALNYF